MLRKPGILFIFLAFVSCTKKIGHTASLVSASNTPAPVNTSCQYSGSTIISFSTTIYPLLNTNCLSCHATPGVGGINLDNYSQVKGLAQSGSLLSVITNTDPSNTIMPPPPQKSVDSCGVKAINLWISQGCPNN